MRRLEPGGLTQGRKQCSGDGEIGNRLAAGLDGHEGRGYGGSDAKPGSKHALARHHSFGFLPFPHDAF